MIKTLIATTLMMMLSTTPVTTVNPRTEMIIVEPERVIPIAPIKKYAKEFLGFQLEGSCNTQVNNNLREALKTYTGPKIKITSLKRHRNNKSRHNIGLAADFEFSHELILWLVSEEGTKWRDQHHIEFFIEGRPGSKKLVPYKLDEQFSKYVFENPFAEGRTGDHIHIHIK